MESEHNKNPKPRDRVYKGYRLVNHGYYPPDRCTWWEAQSLVTGEADFRATTLGEVKALIDLEVIGFQEN